MLTEANKPETVSPPTSYTIALYICNCLLHVLYEIKNNNEKIDELKVFRVFSILLSALAPLY